MKQLMDRTSELIGRCSEILAMLSGIMIMVMFITIIYEITARHVWGTPAGWVLDLCKLLMIAVAYLGAAHLARIKGHVSVDLLTSKLSEKSRAVCEVISLCLMLSFAVFLVWASWDLTCEFYSRGVVTETVRLPKYPAIILIPVAGSVLCLQLIRMIFDTVLGLYKQ